jgi:hypothetical protein
MISNRSRGVLPSVSGGDSALCLFTQISCWLVREMKFAPDF